MGGRRKIQHTFFRYCKNCDKRFQPSNKYNRCCEECLTNKMDKFKMNRKK